MRDSEVSGSFLYEPPGRRTGRLALIRMRSVVQVHVGPQVLSFRQRTWSSPPAENPPNLDDVVDESGRVIES